VLSVPSGGKCIDFFLCDIPEGAACSRLARSAPVARALHVFCLRLKIGLSPQKKKLTSRRKKIQKKRRTKTFIQAV
jgi:hypothetical protein